MTLRRASFLAAVGIAPLSLLAFGLVHAFWIIPIWDRLLGGLPFTIVGALVIGWSYAELRATGRLPRSGALAGFLFGLGIWLTMIPATLVTSVLRMTGVHSSSPWLGTFLEWGSACLTGFVIGRAFGPGLLLTLSTTVAAAVLLAVQAGPIAVVNGRRPTGLFFLMAPIYALCGLAQGVLTAALERIRTRRSHGAGARAGAP